VSITNVIAQVSDVAFYREFLQAAPVGEPTADRAVLDLGIATLELLRKDGGRPSTWRESDTYRGFRHIGLKVKDLDAVVVRLKGAGATFRLDPLDVPRSGARIAFFFDPDGLVIELVERHLTYHDVHDEAAVADELSMPAPGRPRFDHIGHTVADLDRALAYYGPLGFTHAGTLHVEGTEGDRLDFLRSGQTVLELFSFLHEPTIPNPVDAEALGFVAMEVPGVSADNGRPVTVLPDGRVVIADADDLGLIGAHA